MKCVFAKSPGGFLIPADPAATKFVASLKVGVGATVEVKKTATFASIASFFPCCSLRLTPGSRMAKKHGKASRFARILTASARTSPSFPGITKSPIGSMARSSRAPGRSALPTAKRTNSRRSTTPSLTWCGRRYCAMPTIGRKPTLTIW